MGVSIDRCITHTHITAMHCKTFHILQVNPAETWLRNDGSDLAYFPKADGTFDLSDVSQYCILTVEGPLLSSPLPSRSSNTARSISVSSTPSLTGSSTSMPGRSDLQLVP